MSFINIPFPTLGGKQVWRDEFCSNFFTIQKNILTNHYRLLNTRKIRLAWGSYEHCFEKMIKKKQKDTGNNKLIVLLHGVLRSKDSMKTYLKLFKNSQYDVININYPSRHADINTHSKQVSSILNKLTKNYKSISFITHSMGGLIARLAVSYESQWQSKTEKICMLFPPNNGAHLANIWHHHKWFKLLFGKSNKSLTSEVAKSLPIPSCETMIIAGTKTKPIINKIIQEENDGTVGLSETILPNAKIVKIKTDHTFGLYNKEVKKTVLSFFKH